MPSNFFITYHIKQITKKITSIKINFHYNAMFLMKKKNISLNKAKIYGFIWNVNKKIYHKIKLAHVVQT